MAYFGTIKPPSNKFFVAYDLAWYHKTTFQHTIRDTNMTCLGSTKPPSNKFSVAYDLAWYHKTTS
jgi:hypothetical protein